MDLTMHNVVGFYIEDHQLDGNPTYVTSLSIVTSDGDTIDITLFHRQKALPRQRVNHPTKQARREVAQIRAKARAYLGE